MKNSDPIALDRHDIHVLLDLIGGYGAVVALGIVATLSVCAAFFIYRSVRGQCGKGCGDNGSGMTASTEDASSPEERGDKPTESTGEYQEDKQKKCISESESRDGVDLLATDNTHLPTEVSEKDQNESTLKDLEEITDELLTELEPASEDRADSDLDQSMEMDPEKHEDNVECEDQIELGDAGREAVGDICEDSPDVDAIQQLDCQPETGKSVKEETEEVLRDQDMSETGLSVDTDEPSETESAQEILNERQQDVLPRKPQEDLLGHAFTTQSNSFTEQAADGSDHGKIRFEAEHKTSVTEDVEHDWRSPQSNDIDCCCCDKKMNMTEKMKGPPWFHSGTSDVETLIKHQHHSNRFYYPNEPLHQNFLGFHTDMSFCIGSSTQMSLSRESGEKKADEEGASTAKKRQKNEISIMDAIMDNNEWLNVGGPELRDLPWLTPTSTGACSASSMDEKHTNEGGEELETIGQVKDSLVKEDEELANKRVATVQPLPQLVHVTFRIHYITFSSSQLVAVTGSLHELGAWESFVPLHRAKDGFWANTITLPVESQVEWKFVLVEDGKIARWEECGNRCLVLTSQDEELYLDKCWGCI